MIDADPSDSSLFNVEDTARLGSAGIAEGIPLTQDAILWHKMFSANYTGSSKSSLSIVLITSRNGIPFFFLANLNFSIFNSGVTMIGIERLLGISHRLGKTQGLNVAYMAREFFFLLSLQNLFTYFLSIN